MEIHTEMAFIQKMKLNHELMEKRLRELRAKMEKEKEERRNQLNTRWKSLRPSPKLKNTLNLGEKTGVVPKVKCLKEDKPKLMSCRVQRGTSKQNETARKSVETNSTNSSLELCCMGSSLHNQRRATRIDDPKTFQSCAVATQSTEELNATLQFVEKSGELRVEKECGSLLSGVYDEEASSQLFQAAVLAWRESVKKVECSEKGTNPFEGNNARLNCEIVDYVEQLLKQNTQLVQSADIDFKGVELYDRKQQQSALIDDSVNLKEQDELVSVVEFDNLKVLSAETGRKKTSYLKEKESLVSTSTLKSSVETVELESAPFDPSVELHHLELGPINAMYEERERRNQQIRPRLLVTPMFSDDAYSGQPSTPSRWTNSRLGTTSLMLNSNLRSPSPRFVNTKYRHVQSKVAQIWQSPSPSPMPRKKNVDKRIGRKQLSLNMDKRDSVSDEVVNETIGLYVQRLSPSEPLTSSPTEILDSDITCEDFGIKDFLTLDVNNLMDATSTISLPNEDDIGKTLLIKPPVVLDCHVAEMIGADFDPPLDDKRTPTPPPETDLDGFPDECLLLKDKDDASYSTGSGDVSLNIRISSADSHGESENKALEQLENEMATLPIEDGIGGDDSVDSQVFMELSLDDDDGRSTAQTEREEEVRTVMSLK